MSPVKRKAASKKRKAEKNSDATASTSKKSKKSTTDDMATRNSQFKMLENGHIDFIFRGNDDDSSDGTTASVTRKQKQQRRIYLILSPVGTQDKTSKRRLIFTKTRIEEDEGPHTVRIETMANTGSGSESGIINKDTVSVVGQVAVGDYSILFDNQTQKTHFVYVLHDNNKNNNYTVKDLQKKLNGKSSFTIEIQNREEHGKKLLDKLHENIWLFVHPERLVFDQAMEIIFTQNSDDLTKQHAQFLSSHSSPSLKEYEELWRKLNDNYKAFPKYQNLSIPGVSEHDLQQTEQRLGNIKLPDDIKNAVRIHNGRPKYEFGLSYRSPTTDLLPLDEWRPYESEEWCNDLYEFGIKDNEAEDTLKEDLREHLKVYDGDAKSVTCKQFKELKTELLVIGEGMDDYVEQYLLGLKTGTIYLQILNIPEWNKIGTFKQWVEMTLKEDNLPSDEDEGDDD